MENPAPTTFSGNGTGTGTGDSSLVPDANSSQIGSASGGGAAAVNSGGDVEFGFQREEFGQGSLVGTVQIYERHVFLCYKTPEKWPSHVEAPEFDRLPRLLSAALSARKGDFKKKTRLTICEGEDGTDSSNGDVLIFPDMIRYRQLTHFDVDNFVEEVLVKETEWLPGAVETLTESYVFVCSHGSRDRRCGVCGPPLIKKFKEEIEARGLQGQVCVSACSHIGGHKYAGNVIIFSPNVDGEITGHWYGYISPDDVPVLLEQHIRKGEVVAHLWRGQMGLSQEDQKKAHELRLHLNGKSDSKQNAKESTKPGGLDGIVHGTMNGATGCCQGMGNTTCCQNQASAGKPNHDKVGEHETQKIAQNSSEDTKGTSTWKVCAVPTWFKIWEREDTYAAIAVATAVFSVAAAYGCYRQQR